MKNKQKDMQNKKRQQKQSLSPSRTCHNISIYDESKREYQDLGPGTIYIPSSQTAMKLRACLRDGCIVSECQPEMILTDYRMIRWTDAVRGESGVAQKRRFRAELSSEKDAAYVFETVRRLVRNRYRALSFIRIEKSKRNGKSTGSSPGGRRRTISHGSLPLEAGISRFRNHADDQTKSCMGRDNHAYSQDVCKDDDPRIAGYYRECHPELCLPKKCTSMLNIASQKTQNDCMMTDDSESSSSSSSLDLIINGIGEPVNISGVNPTGQTTGHDTGRRWSDARGLYSQRPVFKSSTPPPHENLKERFFDRHTNDNILRRRPTDFSAAFGPKTIEQVDRMLPRDTFTYLPPKPAPPVRTVSIVSHKSNMCETCMSLCDLRLAETEVKRVASPPRNSARPHGCCNLGEDLENSCGASNRQQRTIVLNQHRESGKSYDPNQRRHSNECGSFYSLCSDSDTEDDSVWSYIASAYTGLRKTISTLGQRYLKKSHNSVKR